MAGLAKLLGIILVLILLSGCVAGKGLVINPAYTREGTPSALAPPDKTVTLALSLFEDGRPIKERIGTRRGYQGEPDFFRYGGASFQDMVTRAVEAQVKKAAIPTQLISSWDLSQANIPPAGQDFLLGGRIDAFWADVDSRWYGSKTKVRVELTMALANPKERRILWQNAITSTSEYQEPLFDQERVQRVLGDALSNAVNKILENADLQRLLGLTAVLAPPRPR